MNKCKEYSKWFNINWKKTGGLINTTMASKIIGVSKTRIIQIWKEKNLEKYKYKNDTTMLGLNDILKIKFEKENK